MSEPCHICPDGELVPDPRKPGFARCDCGARISHGEKQVRATVTPTEDGDRRFMLVHFDDGSNGSVVRHTVKLDRANAYAIGEAMMSISHP